MQKILHREHLPSIVQLSVLHHFCRTSKTINAEYAIDPVRNGGLEFQFDEVVRAKEDRRRMDAGDCECCRDVRSIHYICYMLCVIFTDQ